MAMDFIWVLCRTDDNCGPPLQAFADEAAAAQAKKLMAMAYAGVQMFKVPVWPNVTGEAHPNPVEPAAAEPMTDSERARRRSEVFGKMPAGAISDLCRTEGHEWTDGVCQKCGEHI